MDNEKHTINSLVNTFGQKKVLVIGDTIVDHYVRGTLLGTSAETPTIVAREIGEEFSLGGAFLVCRNLLQLQAQVRFISLLGKDREAQFVESFEHPNFELLSVSDPDRKTTVKRRYWVDGYKLLQFDQLDERPLSLEHQEEVVSIVSKEIASASAVILSDYRHGLLTEGLIPRLVSLVTESGKPLYVDSQVSQKKANHALYHGAEYMCLNRKEACAVCPELESELQFEPLLQTLGSKNIIIKDGERGSIAHIEGKEYSTAAYPANVVDTCGAGDAFLAAFSLTDSSYPKESLFIANTWAGLSTQIAGPQPPEFHKLQKVLEDVWSVSQ